MTFIIPYQIFFFLLIIYSSIELNSHLRTPLLKSLIHRRQLLDGTAKSGGVAPKPPGSDNVFSNNPMSSLTQQSTMQQIFSSSATTRKINEVTEEDRSIKDTASTDSSSKSSLLASILAPTGILGLIGAAVGAFLYKKNQTNSSTNDNRGFLSQFFSGNSNAIIQNILEEKYLPVGNIS
jgi:hypothetical protein